MIAQHMAQNGHAELLMRVLNQHSALPVQLATDGCMLQADVVYLLPAGFHGEVAGRHLQLIPREANALSCPSVTRLFRSLAAHYAERSIALVLSGVGSDGGDGCRAICDAGGTVFVQHPRTAEYDGMPQTALDAVGAQQALDPAAMPAAIYQRIGLRIDPYTHASVSNEEILINQLMGYLHEVTGTDLRGYKEETLLRRTGKRVAELHLESLAAYLEHVRRHPAELEILKRLLFVTVSAFFRDPASFIALASYLQAALLVQTAEPFVVWVPGCGNGEEVYSLAILLYDLARQEGVKRPLRITGTDLNESALVHATTACYAESQLHTMPEAFRTHYLTRKTGQYEVVPEIRALCSFETGDAFARLSPEPLDLVSCRNLLIYLKAPRQERLIQQLYGQLRTDGLLFLGQSESLAPTGRTLFTSLNADHRIFRKRQTSG